MYNDNVNELLEHAPYNSTLHNNFTFYNPLNINLRQLEELDTTVRQLVDLYDIHNFDVLGIEASIVASVSHSLPHYQVTNLADFISEETLAEYGIYIIEKLGLDVRNFSLDSYSDVRTMYYMPHDEVYNGEPFDMINESDQLLEYAKTHKGE